MNFLFIGGQPNTGKSETLTRVFSLLSKKFTTINNVHPNTALPPTVPLQDFSVILKGVNAKGKQVTILIHSPTDDVPNINLLEQNIKIYTPDIIISSIRDINWQRQKVLGLVGKNFNFEIPLARVTRIGKNSPSPTNYSTAILWYQKNIDNTINLVIKSAPFDL
jgi:hypothetical protein